MRSKLQATARIVAVGLAMTFGSLTVTATAAQDAADPAATEEEGGFDDWGLLGLLGLAGLGGLLKRPERDVRTVDRPVDARH